PDILLVSSRNIPSYKFVGIEKLSLVMRHAEFRLRNEDRPIRKNHSPRLAPFPCLFTSWSRCFDSSARGLSLPLALPNSCTDQCPGPPTGSRPEPLSRLLRRSQVVRQV